ncbi:hypothetical protein Q1695_001764 [Nippostrongylus brasiliensis]|nr:hypothetical protein Q1695_001764 [Nippostrongylus brasiliensis]
MMLEGDKQRTEKDRYRTCCSVCHIKFGTVVLGVVESIVCIVLLVTFIQQVLWKTGGSHNCFNNILRDCLIFQFSHFSVTLIFDYIVIVMMVFILIAVCLLFFGILSDTSCLLLPHILVQGIFLLFSIGYFGLYAVSYFYGDLYVHSRPFAWNHFMERMWLATLLIVLALFQTYLFSAVIRCSMYISTIEDYRRHRATEFERCSERVRRAKENGLWRTTSWGGGFQQYKGQFEKENKQKKSTKRKGIHVQWSTQKPDVTELDETVQYERTHRNDNVETLVSQPLGHDIEGAQSTIRSTKLSHQRRAQLNYHKSGDSTNSSFSTHAPEVPSSSSATRRGSASSVPQKNRDSVRRQERDPELSSSMWPRKSSSTSPNASKVRRVDSCGRTAYSSVRVPSHKQAYRRSSLDTHDVIAAKSSSPRQPRRTNSTTLEKRDVPHIKRVSITATPI